MQVVRHDNARSLIQSAGCWLERDEAENNVILGVCARLRDDTLPVTSQRLFLTCEDDAAVVGAALMTPPYKLVTTRWPLDQASVLADFLTAANISIPGVFAPVPQAEMLATQWRALTRQTCGLAMEHTLYKCRAVVRIKPSAGALRAATPDDVPRLSQWRREFIAEVRSDDPQESATVEVERAVAAGNSFVWQDDQVVCAATIGRQSRHGATITFVFTPPAYRGRGYATSCVAAVTQKVFRRGKNFASLFTDSANEVSNAVYRRIGYTPVCDFQQWTFAKEPPSSV